MKPTFTYILIILFSLSLSAQEITNRIPFLDEDKWGYANNTGELVIAAIYDEAFPFYEGAAKV
ncbi:MAG: WG repeat-containing protein, partial [Bacteroidales bacterium]|nr:WG repeat-containing protein [Bacteroidales bacterium]